MVVICVVCAGRERGLLRGAPQDPRRGAGGQPQLLHVRGERPRQRPPLRAPSRAWFVHRQVTHLCVSTHPRLTYSTTNTKHCMPVRSLVLTLFSGTSMVFDFQRWSELL